jgi:hypothetical protein
MSKVERPIEMKENAVLEKTSQPATFKLRNPLDAANYSHMPLGRNFRSHEVEEGEQVLDEQVHTCTASISVQTQIAYSLNRTLAILHAKIGLMI